LRHRQSLASMNTVNQLLQSLYCCQPPCDQDQHVEVPEGTQGLQSDAVHIPAKYVDDVYNESTTGTMKEFDALPSQESLDSHHISGIKVDPSQAEIDNLENAKSVLRLDTPEHQEPLGFCKSLVLLIVVVLPNAALLVAYSSMGYGQDVYNAVAPPTMSMTGDGLLCLSCLLAAILLVCDWWKMSIFVKVHTGVFVAGVFYAGTLFKGRKYPWAVMLLTLFLEPLFIGILRFSWCIKVRRQKFYAAVSIISFLAAIITAVIWVLYIYVGDHKWNQDTKDELIAATKPVYEHVYSKRTLDYQKDCAPNVDLSEYNKNVRSDIKKACSQASTLWFLSWTCPFIAVGCNMVMSAFCIVTGVLTSMDSVGSIQRTLTRFLLSIAFILSGMYATATMSATSIRLGSTMLAFFCAAMGILCAWVMLEIDPSRLVDASKKSKLVELLVKLWTSDWSRAVLVGALGGPGLCFVALNYLTQKRRKAFGVADDPSSAFTPLGRSMMKRVSVWNWTSILLKIAILGELFFTLQVGVMKVTYVFLSWLNTTLRDTSIGIVVLLVYLIGGCMFLLPPVPGLPVYVFAGILLGEKGRQDDKIGFWLGCVIAMVLGLFTKLCACVGQYMIGYYLGKSLKVQQLIGVDKVPTRAIEKILSGRGLKLDKVAVLVGGPDWPTSVTCGIVRTNIPQMLLGTIPVVTLLAPCIFAGACMGRVEPGEDSEWNMAANAFTASAAVVNMGSMAYAVWAIGQVVQNHGDELAKPRPEHEAVAELTRQEKAAVDQYRDTIKWENLSCCWKAFVLGAAVLMLLSNGVFTIFAESCFRPFAVSSKIKDPWEKDGLDGNVFSIIYPMGWIPMGWFALGVLLHVVFIKVMARRAQKALTAKGGLFRRSSLIGLG